MERKDSYSYFLQMMQVFNYERRITEKRIRNVK